MGFIPIGTVFLSVEVCSGLTFFNAWVLFQFEQSSTGASQIYKFTMSDFEFFFFIFIFLSTPTISVYVLST